jgi:hypothetical protein
MQVKAASFLDAIVCEFCVERLCIVLHLYANKATAAPATV